MQLGLKLVPGMLLFLVVCALAKPILVPIAFALFLALLLAGPCEVLERRLRLPRLLAVLFVLASVWVGLGTLVFGVVDQATTFFDRWDGTDVLHHEGPGPAPGSYKDRFQRRLGSLVGLVSAWGDPPSLPTRAPASPAGQTGGGRHGTLDSSSGQARGEPGAEEDADPEREAPLSVLDADLNQAKSWLLSGLGTLFSVAMNLVLIAVYVVFLLFDLPGLRKRLALAIGMESVQGERVVGQVYARLRRYLGTVTCINLCLGLCIFGAMSLIGLEFALLWGVLAAVLNFIPFVGASMAGIPPVLMALIQFDGLGPAVAVLVFYVLIQATEGYFITPYVVGRLTSINPLAILVAAVLWGWLWGPMGLMLASPMTVCLHEIGLHVAYLRPLATLLGRGDPAWDSSSAGPPAAS